MHVHLGAYISIVKARILRPQTPQHSCVYVFSMPAPSVCAWIDKQGTQRACVHVFSMLPARACGVICTTPSAHMLRLLNVCDMCMWGNVLMHGLMSKAPLARVHACAVSMPAQCSTAQGAACFALAQTCVLASALARRNGGVQQAIIQLETPVVGMVRLGKSIMVACMNDVVHSYQVGAEYVRALACHGLHEHGARLSGGRYVCVCACVYASVHAHVRVCMLVRVRALWRGGKVWALVHCPCAKKWSRACVFACLPVGTGKLRGASALQKMLH